jgi:hypothetical protein
MFSAIGKSEIYKANHTTKWIKKKKMQNLIGIFNYGIIPNPKFVMGLGVTITTQLGPTRPRQPNVYYFQLLSPGAWVAWVPQNANDWIQKNF